MNAPPRIPRLPLSVGDAGLMIVASLLVLGAVTLVIAALLAVRHVAEVLFA